MTKKEAIKECKELWREIEESGETKGGFLNSPAGKKWRGKGYWGGCPLCEYADDDCSNCPLMTQYGKNCGSLGFRDRGHSLPSFLEAVRGLK